MTGARRARRNELMRLVGDIAKLDDRVDSALRAATESQPAAITMVRAPIALHTLNSLLQR